MFAVLNLHTKTIKYLPNFLKQNEWLNGVKEKENGLTTTVKKGMGSLQTKVKREMEKVG